MYVFKLFNMHDITYIYDYCCLKKLVNFIFYLFITMYFLVVVSFTFLSSNN